MAIKHSISQCLADFADTHYQLGCVVISIGEWMQFVNQWQAVEPFKNVKNVGKGPPWSMKVGTTFEKRKINFRIATIS